MAIIEKERYVKPLDCVITYPWRPHIRMLKTKMNKSERRATLIISISSDDKLMTDNINLSS
jgi:hypothetical protein